MQNSVPSAAVPTGNRPLRDSSLFITVPEAEAVVGRWRALYDRTAPVGFPAHITLLYPFLPERLIDDDVIRKLAELVDALPPFSFRLGGVCGFRGLVWLAPEPMEPFIRLTSALCAEYPKLRPYGDRTRTVPPHLTVARSQDVEFLREVTIDLTNAPLISATAREVWLLTEGQPEWRIHSKYQFSGRREATGEEPTTGRHTGEAPAPRGGSPSSRHRQEDRPL